MSERGKTYDDVLAMASERFEAILVEAERTVAAAGGRFMSKTALNECMAKALVATIEGTSDIALLAVLATRPELLHADPELHGDIPTPRQSLDHALKVAAYRDLATTRLARLGEGQHEDTLQETVEAALNALAEVESSGARFPLAADARRILSTGDWEDGMSYGMGMPLAGFLIENGRPGLGNDLMAAFEARETVMARGTGPGPR